MISQVIDHMPRPRRLSFTLRQPLKTDTIGYPIDALPVYTEKSQQPIMERPPIRVSPTWKKDTSSEPRGRSQSVPPSMGEGRQTSRRLVKKQPPVKQQEHSRRESSTSSDNRFGLISSISTRIRSRRPSLSRNSATTDGNLPTLHGPRQSDEQNAIPAPRVSATLPPGFGATITRDLAQGTLPVLAVPNNPRGKDREVGKISGYAAQNYSGVVDKRHTLRRAGAPINSPLSDEPSPIQPANNNKAHPDAQNARPVKKHTDRKDITIPDSLRIGRSKKIEPGPKSPKRARPKAANSINPPNYSLPNQKQEQTYTCQDCQQKKSRAAQNRESQNIKGQTGNQNTARILTPTSPHRITASPKPFEAAWPLTGPGKEEAASKPDENKEQTPTPNITIRLSPQQPATVSNDSTPNDPPTPVVDSPALSNPPVVDTLSKTTNQENNATDTSSSGRNSASTPTISPRALAPPTQAKEKIPRNTMSPKQDKYLAKIFVVCCQCHFWHDIPSALYAKMIIPDHLSFSEQWPTTAADRRLSAQVRDGGIQKNQNSTDAPDNTVQCCWCSHPMAKACCTGWTTMVHLLEKHH